jgi:alkaline phosphatase D
MTIRIPRQFSRGLSRRRFLSTAAATGAGAFGAIAMPYLSRAADRPVITHGVQSGDVGPMAAWCGRAPTGRRR